jgi:hypothetical protein
MLVKYSYSPHLKPQTIIDEFTRFYKDQEHKGRERGVDRKLSYRAGLQSNLSKFKLQFDAPEEFKKQLHMTKDDMITLNKEKGESLRGRSIDIQAIDGDNTVLDCRQLLQSPDFCMKVIAVACLTGRRMAEIIVTVKFDPPETQHFTDLKYWTCVSGLLKQRGENRCIDIPLFAPREEINFALKALRAQCGVMTVEEVNTTVGKKIFRAMKKYCPQIGNIHAFRKFYVQMANIYFNERNCSLPRLGSDYLGHKSMDEAVLTYLNFRIQNAGSLNFKK